MDSVIPPLFSADFKADLLDLFRWRRDVRRFQTTNLPDGAMERLIETATLAPSVGNAQPWRFVIVDDADRRAEVKASFERCNQEALAGYHGDQAKVYAGLKLAGLDRAPVQLAVFCDDATPDGHGLGRKTMPEMLSYSVVAAIQTLWLAARAEGIGVGWVSILEPETVTETLEVPDAWRLIAYLCIGYPEEHQLEPELVRAGWQDRKPLSDVVTRR